jgi:hypothetical protein
MVTFTPLASPEGMNAGAHFVTDKLQAVPKLDRSAIYYV